MNCLNSFDQITTDLLLNKRGPQLNKFTHWYFPKVDDGAFSTLKLPHINGLEHESQKMLTPNRTSTDTFDQTLNPLYTPNASSKRFFLLTSK